MAENSSQIAKAGRRKNTNSVHLEHLLFTSQCPSYFQYHRIKSFFSVWKMDVSPMCLYAHLLHILYSIFLNLVFVCILISLCLWFCLVFGFGFCLFFLFSVLCQQLLKYLCDVCRRKYIMFHPQGGGLLLLTSQKKAMHVLNNSENHVPDPCVM